MMTRNNTALLATIAAIGLAAGASAHPGGGVGGGIGGGMGGGMGIGAGGMGNAAGSIGNGGMRGASDDISSRTDASVGSTQASTQTGLSPRSSTSQLTTNTHMTKALSTSLTRRGIALPSGGLSAACSGYRNVGNCVSALHVAQNLNLPGGFAALKARTTGSSAVSLGRAIQQLSPGANANAAVKTANRQAGADLAASGHD